MELKSNSETRICRNCGEKKPIGSYYKAPTGKGGRNGMCKACVLLYNIEDRKKNPEKLKKRNRLCYLKNRERIIKDTSEYTKNHPEVRDKSRKNYYKNNKHKADARGKAWKAKKEGFLTQTPCGICGAIKTEAHHEDYNKPFDVYWYCRRCHAELHRKRRA